MSYRFQQSSAYYQYNLSAREMQVALFINIAFAAKMCYTEEKPGAFISAIKPKGRKK